MTGTILLGHLVDVLLVAAVLTAAFGIGGWVLSRIGQPSRPIEELLFSTTLGTGALGVVLLGLGSAGLLDPVLLWATVLLCGAVGWRELRRLPDLLRACARLITGSGGLPAFFAGSILVVVGGALLAGALAPPTDWDSLMYHLEVPRQFLEEGRIFVPEDNLHVAFLGISQLLYLPLLSVGGWAGPAVLNGAFALLLGLAVLGAGNRFFGRTTAVVSLVAFWGTSSLILVASTPRTDVTVALFLFLAHYGVLVLLDSKEEWGIWAAAILVGLAVGVKYHALAFLVALTPIAGWAMVRTWGDDRRKLLSVLGGCVAFAAVAALPAAVKNQVLLGGALYPFFTDQVLPPWLAQLSGSSAHPSTVSLDVYGAVGQAREPVTLMGLLFNPASLTVEVEGRSFVTNPILFLLPLSLFFLRDRLIAALLVPAVGYLLVLLVPVQVTNLRYLIPAMPALTLVTVEGVRRFGERVLANGQLQTALLIGSLIALVPAAKGVDRELLGPSRLAAAAGLISPEEYLWTSPVPGFPQYFAATRWLSELTAPDARVVLLFEARGYYFERSVLQDNLLVNWPLLLSTDATSNCLEDAGITHVLVNTGAAAYYRARGTDLGRLQLERFPWFADRCLELLHREGGFELFRVVPDRSVRDHMR